MANKSTMDFFRSEVEAPPESPFENKEKPEAKEVVQEEEQEEPEEEQEEEEQEDSSRTNQEEEESNEEEEEELEDELKLKRKNRKQEKEKKRESFSNLRKSRDKYRQELEQLKEEYEKVKFSATPEVKEALDFIREQKGDLSISVDDVKNLYAAQEELDKTRQEFEEYRKQVNIRESDEWKESYERPFVEAQDNFLGVIVNTDDNGEVAHPEYFAQLQQALYKTVADKGQVTAAAVKAVINKFAESYESATGEEYIKPSVSEVTSSLRSLVRLDAQAREAFKNWEEEAQKRSKIKSVEQQDQEEKAMRAAKRQRLKMAHEAVSSFDVDALDGIVEEDDIEKAFNAAHKANESQFDNPAEATPYNELLTVQAKGMMFDSLLERIQDLEEELEIKNKDRPVRGNSSPKNAAKKTATKGSWLGENNPLSNMR